MRYSFDMCYENPEICIVVKILCSDSVMVYASGLHAWCTRFECHPGPTPAYQPFWNYQL